MKTTVENYKGKEYNIVTHFTHRTRGYGGYSILCKVEYKQNKNVFNLYSTDTKFIDLINDLKADEQNGSDIIQQAYYDKFFDEYKESIIEYCEDMDELEQEERDSEFTIEELFNDHKHSDYDFDFL